VRGSGPGSTSPPRSGCGGSMRRRCEPAVPRNGSRRKPRATRCRYCWRAAVSLPAM
jgi:hypothetical protein